MNKKFQTYAYQIIPHFEGGFTMSITEEQQAAQYINDPAVLPGCRRSSGTVVEAAKSGRIQREAPIW